MLLHFNFLQEKFGRKLLFFTLVMITVIAATSLFFIVFSLPEEVKVIQGQNQKYVGSGMISLAFEKDQAEIASFSVNADKIKKTSGTIKFMGIIPLKKITVDVMPDIKLVPSGEAIGVKIESKGLLVVGLSSITTNNGKKCSPAVNAGFEVGDIILNIDNHPVEKEKDIVEYLNGRENKEAAAKVLVQRGKKQETLVVHPIQSGEDNLYKLGLWVKDSITGIGTMTFYDNTTNSFGALGHGITDSDSGVLVDISKGSIMKSKIASVEKARKTTPGELVGIFYEGNNSYGTINRNSHFGIYGHLNNIGKNNNAEPMPIGLSYQVKEGPAQILTTVNSNKVETFDIEIQRVARQSTPDSKSMLIKITDPRLLEKTGGIVQGMSGSPIIQDGKLVGAVTHVLINDPTRGYGIFIEWMLEESKRNEENLPKQAVGQ